MRHLNNLPTANKNSLRISYRLGKKFQEYYQMLVESDLFMYTYIYITHKDLFWKILLSFPECV